MMYVCTSESSLDIFVLFWSGVQLLVYIFHLLKVQILTTLKRNIETPVTCKIRLLKSPQETVELARRIEKTGVSAVAVHGRYLTSVICL